MTDATVQVVENPNTDEITVAQSKVDIYQVFVDEMDVEAAKLQEKVARFEGWVKDARDAIEDSQKRRKQKVAALKEAKAELQALREANPELAARLDEQAVQAKLRRVEDLKAELAKLEGSK